jgi:hypothetical protein
MVDESNGSEYVAALCHMREGWLVDYDSTRFIATNEDEAKQEAAKWAASVIGVVTEKTWLQVTSDGKAIYSKVFDAPNAPGP